MKLLGCTHKEMEVAMHVHPVEIFFLLLYDKQLFSSPLASFKQFQYNMPNSQSSIIRVRVILSSVFEYIGEFIGELFYHPEKSVLVSSRSNRLPCA